LECYGGVASYTVATVLGYDYTGKCYVMFSERMQGVDILDQVRRVEYLANQFNVQMIVAIRLWKTSVWTHRGSRGPDKIVPIQYCAAKTHLDMIKLEDFYSR